jgi:hypothetical protein
LASKRRRPALALAAAVLLGGGWFAASAAAQEAIAGEYNFTLAPDGTPIYTQVLRWRNAGDAFEFEFALRRKAAAGAAAIELRRERLKANEIALSLDPGDYEYRVVAYNLLGQAEDATDWIGFSVLKAEIPAVREVSPVLILMDDAPDRRVTIRGDKLMPGCRVRLVSGAVAYEGRELSRSGEGEIVLAFPDEAYAGGVYDLAVENPGGLSTRRPAALDIRPALPAPALTAPAAGFAFGPAELRAERSIRLEWAAVPGATEYRLAVYAPGRAEALLVRDGLAATAWTIDDLSILERGAYAWRVVASARDRDGRLQRLGLTAASDFAVRLPALAPVRLAPGDDYYGLDPATPPEAAAGLVPLAAEAGADCSYELAAGALPVFTQTVAWTADPNTLDCDFQLRRLAADAPPLPVLSERTTAGSVALKLEPGDYACRVVAYNLLGQAERTTDWVPFLVRAAVVPGLGGAEPAVLFMDDAPEKRVVIRGQGFAPDSLILLRRTGDAAGELYYAAVGERQGDGEATVTFPEEVYSGGVYDLAVVNPGRLTAVKTAAFDVRAALPAPAVIAPVAGFVFGPAELKARRAVDLAWAPVEGATGYRLAVYSGDAAGTPLIETELAGARYSIEDLTAFARGGYVWKLSAFARDASGSLERLGLSAESAFAIQLPPAAAAVPVSGGVYFGY